MKTAICAIIKDEHRYLKEWIDYHLNVGFNHIYLFEDYGSVSHKEIVREYKDVTLQTLADIGIGPDEWSNGKKCKRQASLYNWALQYYKNSIDWLALIDVDEFFEFEDDYTLNKLIEEFKDKSGLYLYWKIITASGQIKYENKPVRERFTEVGSPLKRGICWTLKSFVNLQVNDKFMRTIHECYDLCNTLGLQTPRVICHKKAWINHYFTKSWEEWKNRWTRGDLVWGHRQIDDFFEINPDLVSCKKELKRNSFDVLSRLNSCKILEAVLVKDGFYGLEIPKCGLSSIGLLGSKFYKDASFNHRVSQCYKGMRYAVHKENIPKNQKVFATYRDPVSRWCSFFYNKCKKGYPGSVMVDLMELYGSCVEEILTLTEKCISNYQPNEVDEHIRRQSDIYNEKDVDYIVPIDYLDDFLKSQGIEPIEHQNCSGEYHVDLTPEQEERIKKLYAADYELLKSPKLWKPSKKD